MYSLTIVSGHFKLLTKISLAKSYGGYSCHVTGVLTVKSLGNVISVRNAQFNEWEMQSVAKSRKRQLGKVGRRNKDVAGNSLQVEKQ